MNLDLTVYSFYENVVLMLGWIVNNAIWSILNSTMIAALPFLALVAGEWYRARREGEDEGNKSLLSLNRIETSLYAMLLIYIFAAYPLMGVQFAPAQIDQAYSDQCDVRVAAGPSGTGGGAALGGQTANMPIWWALVHAISTGLTNTMIAALPCQPDYVYLHSTVDTTRVQDPELKQELGNFQVWCYGAARYQLLQQSSAVGNERSRDVGWLGSTFFLNTPGYYDSLYAKGPVKSFAYNAQRDAGRGTTPAQGGYPSCKDWWLAPDHGLKARLREQLDPTFWDHLYAWLPGGTSGDATNYAIRGLLQHQSASNSAATMGSAGGNFADHVLGSLAGMIGVTLSTIPAKGMEHVAAIALPMVQYLVLMAIVIVMPLVIVFSGYGFKAVATLTFAYFGVITLTFWFELSRWLQNHLIDMVYHSDAAKLGFLSGVTSMYDQGVLGLVQAAMLFLFPPLWLGMLAWAGLSVGGGLDNALKTGSGEAANAGRKGGEKGQSAASGGKL